MRSRYLKEGGGLFALSRLVVDPVMVGRLSPKGTGLGDEVSMVLLDYVVVEGMEGGQVRLASGYVCSLSTLTMLIFPSRFAFASFRLGKKSLSTSSQMCKASLSSQGDYQHTLRPAGWIGTRGYPLRCHLWVLSRVCLSHNLELINKYYKMREDLNHLHRH